MNTPIISISDDQNTITHESGVVTVFEVPKGGIFCRNCFYVEWNKSCTGMPCTSGIRNDKRNGIFKLK